MQPGASPRSFDWGDGFRLEWTDSVESKPRTPKLRFFLGFRTLYFENIGKSKNFGKYSENFLLKIAISGHVPTEF